jgi:two-component system NarL family sensor kinase
MRQLSPAPRTRLRVGLVAAGCAALMLIPAVLLLLDQAAARRSAIDQQAESIAHVSADAIDREFASAEALLTGLVASSALDAADFAAFHREAVRALKPAGSWIVVFDRDGHQRINTLRPYGASLPELGGAAEREAAAITETRRAGVFDLSYLPVAGTRGVGLALPVLRDGEVSSVVAIMFAGNSLSRILEQQRLPAGWCSAIVDRAGTTIAQSSGDADAAGLAPVAEQSCGAAAGTVVLARSPSNTTGWTAAVAVPRGDLGAPLRRALLLIAGGCGTLTILVIGSVFLAEARIDRPFRERIEASDARFRVMADTVPSILFTNDADGRCEYANQRFYEYTGMPSGAALDFGWIDAVHPDDEPRAVRSLRDPSPAGDLRLTELRLRAKDGTYRWFLSRSRAIRDPDGRIIKWFGSSTDIDDLKQSDVALRSINERLSAVLSSIDESYYTVDPQWRITFVNPHAARFFGESAESLVGRSIWEVAPEPELQAQFQRALNERAPLRLERRSQRQPDRWFQISCYPWADGLSIFFSNVTRRKTAELALHSTQELLQRTMDALSARIAILDEQGVIMAVNAAWRRSMEENCLPEPVSDVGTSYLAACDAAIPRQPEVEETAAGLREVLRGERREFLGYRACRTPKGLRWFQIRATCFGDEMARRVVLAHEDITEIKEAETGLRELTGRLLRVQDEERRRMARELHDTTAQNLVAALLDIDRLPQTLAAVDEVSQELLDEVRLLVDRSLQELRTFSYLLHPPLLDQLGLASALRWYVRGFESRSGITVSLTVQENIDRMPAAVESALFRAVQEALTNIHRHSGSATADIRLTQSPTEVVLKIRDQGRGMAVDVVSGSAEFAILGVGISGMRARLHQLGGKLEIRSTSKGTTVTATVSLAGEQSMADVASGT